MRRPRTFSASLDSSRYPVPINGISFYSCFINIFRYICCMPPQNHTDDNMV